MLPIDAAFVDTLRLRPVEAMRVLEQLPAGTPSASEAEPYLRSGLEVVVRDRTGDESRCLMFSHRLWCGGVTALHGGFLYPGLSSEVRLACAGAVRRVAATVGRSEHIRGRIHLIEFSFEEMLAVDELKSALTTGVPGKSGSASSAAAQGAIGSVLHIDRAPDDHETVASLMGDTEVLVQHAPTGESALDALRDQDFDAVLCDLDFDDTTGEELISSIRRTRPDLPVAVLTAIRNAERLTAAVRAGASEVLLKPIEPARLFGALAKMLGVQLEALRGSGVARLADLVLDLPGAIRDRDFARVGSLCERIRTAGAGEGAHDVATAAGAVIEALHRSGAVAGAAMELQALAASCRSRLDAV